MAQKLGIPLRGITLFLFGGVAEMEGEPATAGREFLMAIAGPIVSALLVAVFWLLATAAEQAGWLGEVVAVLHFLAWINCQRLVFFRLLLSRYTPPFPRMGTARLFGR